MAARGSQSNAMLYSLIAFVGLFVIATVCAVVFYVHSEEYRTQLDTLRSDTDRLATSRQRGALSRIVGRTIDQQSYLGTMETLVDRLFTAATGQQPPEETPADVKVNSVIMQINRTMEALGDDANPALGAEGISLLGTIRDLKQTLDSTRSRLDQLQSSYYALESQMDALKQDMARKNTLFAEELEKTQTLADEFRDRFEALRQQKDVATAEQVQTYRDRLEDEQERLRQRQQALSRAEDKIDELEALLSDAMAKLEAIRPRPDMRVAAFTPDARIVRVDLQNDLVTLDIGARDHVYRGLTFAIYQSNAPIPEDGQGKAEIEVFQVGEQVSVARIVRMDRRNPIVAEDMVINLIWDADTSNEFVVIGDFDTNRDGRINPDGHQKVKEMIQRWGGRISDTITINTDFIVVGVEPSVPPRPMQDQLDADPTAYQRYEAARQRAAEYDELLISAGRLSVPTFNFRQFIHLIGYDTLSTQLDSR